MNDILEVVKINVEKAVASGIRFTAVFDLDSTLFDVAPRLLQILRDFSLDNAMRAKFPSAIEILRGTKTVAHTYSLRKQIEFLGLVNQPPDFYPVFYDFWKTRFFSNEYLHFDTPYDGAVDYVGERYKSGAGIIYLTGRDVERMGWGTREVLLKWGFPVGNRCEIALKPEKEMDDAVYKRDFLSQLPRESHEVWFFENEPVNIDLVLREVNHVNVVYFDSVHSELAEPPHPQVVPHIKRFR